MNFIKSITTKVAENFRHHKIRTFFVVIILALVVYGIYKTYFVAAAVPQYTLTAVRTGSIIQTVTGSGQVSASNQTDILSQASGAITSIKVSVGQSVKTGDLIATIDSTNAAISLQSAKIAFAKLTQPAKETDLTNANSSLAKAYDSGFNTAAGVFLDLPAIMTGMKDLLYSQNGFLSIQYSSSLVSSLQASRNSVGQSYDAALSQYNQVLQEYGKVSRSSATSSLDALIADTYSTIKAVAQTATAAQNVINQIINTQPDYHASLSSAALTNITTWSNQANGDVSNIVAAQNSILSASNSLSTLLAGSDALDVQSAQLTLEQAERTYNNYFVRAPYDGVIGRIPVSVYSQAGASTVIATIIGEQNIASISLNEVDAAKVKVGQNVNITFDAIDNLNATGTVSVVDQIGTVSSGVVSYGVKILINTADSRIKSGMSVNTTIVTLKKDDVVIVPSGAIKTQNGSSYVQTFDNALIKSLATTVASASTRTLARNFNSASSTRALGAAAINSGSTNSASTRIPLTQTISTSVSPTKVTVTTGVSDDTNTEILDGITAGQYVVTKTTAGSAAQTTTAPSILSSLGARTGGTAATRTTGAAGGVRPGN